MAGPVHSAAVLQSTSFTFNSCPAPVLPLPCSGRCCLSAAWFHRLRTFALHTLTVRGYTAAHRKWLRSLLLRLLYYSFAKLGTHQALWTTIVLVCICRLRHHTPLQCLILYIASEKKSKAHHSPDFYCFLKNQGKACWHHVHESCCNLQHSLASQPIPPICLAHPCLLHLLAVVGSCRDTPGHQQCELQAVRSPGAI